MKKAVVLMLASLAWGCTSQPSLEEASKASVEERNPASPPKPVGPSTAPVQPGPGVTGKPIPPEAPGVPRGAVSPLKDPNSPLSKRSVFYEYDSDTIKDEYRPIIQAHAKYLADNPSARMLIEGNCDERGSREYNVALGQRRAEGLRHMLALLGARESQIETVSLGEEKPRCTADQTEQCYQQNRRSDLLYGGEY